MDYIKLIGFIAAGCTTASFVPQLVKVWKTKSAEDISLRMFSLMTAGLFLWLLYGIFTNDLPLITANAISLVLALAILILRLKL